MEGDEPQPSQDLLQSRGLTDHSGETVIVSRAAGEPDADLVRRLACALRRQLPGLTAQRLMAPEGRLTSDYDPSPPGAREAGVLLLITPGRRMAFIRRADDGSHHGGQIAFPGGAREARDEDLVATALRETEEEIGTPRQAVTVLGSLSPLYIPVTNFHIQPVVGVVRETPAFVCQPGEVDEVILLPVEDFPSSADELHMTRNGRPYHAPCYRFGPVVVWGATAMIMAEFLRVWQTADA